jgi:KaiC/GvpD/RAD55 family RecA-like ATPase
MKEIFPEKYSVLLTGPPGVGKQYFCIDLANYYLNKGENVVFLTSESSPEDIEKRGADIGIDLSANSANLYYVDCYSWSLRQTAPTSPKDRKVVRITNPENLNEIIVKVERIMGIFGGRIRLIAHSLSPFFLHNEDKDVIKFVQLLVTRVKEDGSFIITTLQEGVHSPSTVNTLSYLVDGKVEMRFYEGEKLERQIRAHHLKDVSAETRWRPLVYDKSGFQIKG